MTETYTQPTDNGRKTRQTAPAPSIVQVEIARQYDDNRFLGIHGTRRVLVTVKDPELAKKMLKDAAGSQFGVTANLPASDVETF